MKKCKNCGRDLNDGDVFCSECGTRNKPSSTHSNGEMKTVADEHLSSPTFNEATQGESLSAVEETPIIPAKFSKTNLDQSSAAPTAHKKRNRFIIGGVVGGVVLLAIIAAAFFLLNKDPIVGTWKLYTVERFAEPSSQYSITALNGIQINQDGTAKLSILLPEDGKETVKMTWSKKDSNGKDSEHVEYMLVYADSLKTTSYQIGSVRNEYTMVYNKQLKKMTIDENQERAYYEKASQELREIGDFGVPISTINAPSTAASTSANTQYVGEWISSDKNSADQVMYSGGYVLTIKGISNNDISFDLTTISGSQKIAGIDGTFPMTGNQCHFTYSDDGWGNSGNGTLTFNQDSIGLVITTTKSDPKANWNMGVGGVLKKAGYSPSASASDDVEAMILQGRTRYYSRNELMEMSKYDLNLLRNGLFALEGRQFSSKDLQAYFDKCSWYSPNSLSDDEITAQFNSYQRENLKLVTQVESEKGYR